MVMSLLFSGLPSTVALPLTAARLSPHPTQASNAPRQRTRTSRGRRSGRRLGTDAPLRNANHLEPVLPADAPAGGALGSGRGFLPSGRTRSQLRSRTRGKLDIVRLVLAS